MTLEEAMEILAKIHDTYLLGYKGRDEKALKLGIEALKYYQTTNVPPDHPGYVPLPSETEG